MHCGAALGIGAGTAAVERDEVVDLPLRIYLPAEQPLRQTVPM
jgi:hypothetical protein